MRSQFFALAAAFLSTSAFALPSTSGLEVLAEGEMRPIHFSVRAKGRVQIVRDMILGEERIEFGPDFQMSSGVVLDIKTCGYLESDRPDLRLCLSQAELRQLRGAHSVKIRFPLGLYDQVKIFDLDLVLDHAGAKMAPPTAETP
jgi:hypothetical protein